MIAPPRDCAAIAPLLPWYVNGTLAGEDAGGMPGAGDARAVVAAHLAECPSCSALVEGPVAFRALARTEPPARLLDHVSSRLIVEFVETPGAIDAETARWIETHFEGCDPCRQAAAILRDMAAVPVAAMPAGGEPTRAVHDDRRGRSVLKVLWDLLSRSVLRPLPALAYLLVALLLLPMLGRRIPPNPDATQSEPPTADSQAGSPFAPPPAAPAPVSVLPPVQRLGGGGSYRGVDPGAGATAAVIHVTAGSPVLLELDVDLDRDDIETRGVSFRVTIEVAGRAGIEVIAHADDFDAAGRLRVLVGSGLLAAGGTGEIAVLRVAAGERRGAEAVPGEVVYRRRIAIRS